MYLDIVLYLDQDTSLIVQDTPSHLVNFTDTLSWSLVQTSGAVPPCRLDHAMTTITLPSLTPHNSTDVTSSPISHQSPVTTSLPHLVTVMAPETLHPGQPTDDNLESQILSSGKDGACNDREGDDSDTTSKDASSAAVATSDGERAPLSSTDQSGCVSVTSKCAEAHTLKDCDGSVEEKKKPKLRHMQSCEVVTGLVIFGGMDTSGHMHSDCFIIVPPS